MLRIFERSQRRANRRVIDRLHGEIVAAARDRHLFSDYGIPDTFEGRFDCVTLHAALVLRRLNGLPAPAPDLARDLADAVFRHFDMALREMGVGDTSVPKRMKGLAEAFLGRSAAYDQALREGGAALCNVLSRNIYASNREALRLAHYVQAAAAALDDVPFEALLSEPLPFPAPARID